MTTHKKIKLFLVSFTLVGICPLGFSQDSIRTFVAKSGDGIINVLRREGLDVETYYQKFIDLNQDQISNGSLLKLGKTYKIPFSESSFVNRGRIINLSQNTETAIFETKLNLLSNKEKTLENTVYYLLLDRFDPEGLKVVKTNKNLRTDFALAMSKELLEQGAKVFIFEYPQEENQNLGNFIDAINKRFFKHRGLHQRLLVLDVDDAPMSKSARVSVSHSQHNKESQKLAKSIESIFKEKNIELANEGLNEGAFTDKINLFIANNALPAMSYIKVNKQDPEVKKSADIGATNKEDFIQLITTGIKVDYSTISMEE